MNIEPHSDIRQGAATFFQFLTAYIQAGFTEEQAFLLVRDMVREQVRAGSQRKDDGEGKDS